MLFFVILIFVGFIVYQILKQQKNQLLEQWQLAASSLPGFRCIPGGTVTGYPSLTGLIEGQRIDVAPFFHQEFGNNNTRMTGYRVRCDSPIELPGEAITSLTNHFQKFEVDERRIFCATYGVERSSSNLVAKIRKIETAIRLAEEERERLAAELMAKSKAEIEALKMTNQVEEPKNDAKAPATEAAKGEAAPSTPPPLPSPDDEEPPSASVFLSLGANDVDEDDPVVDEPAPESVPESDAPQEPEAIPEPAAERPVPRAPAGHDPLTRAALDLFATGRNKFEITRQFDGEYNNREIDGHGTLQRVDTYSNDRTFGRGPGVVVEIEVPLPEAPQSEWDADEDDSPLSSREKRPPSVRLRVALPSVEDVLPSSQARELREHVGDEVELVGTLCRCDPFDTRLHLCDGVIG